MSLRWWWSSRMTGRCTRWQRWLPGSGGGLKVLNWNLHSFRLLEIIQVLDSISWVRCASGDVFSSVLKTKNAKSNLRHKRSFDAQIQNKDCVFDNTITKVQ